MRLKMAGLLLLLPLFFTVLLLPFIPHITIRTKEGELLRSLVLEEYQFRVSFLHSVNRGLVVEEYTVFPNTLHFYLSVGKFESFGAGMLDEVPSNTSLEYDDTFLIVRFPLEATQSEVFYASAGIANHTVSSGKREIQLFEVNPNKTSVLSVERRSILDTIVENLK